MRTVMMSLIALVLGAPAVVAHGTLVARCDVPAQVFLDSRFMGVTPLTMTGVGHGIHLVTFRCLVGAGSSDALVTVPPGRTTSIVWGSFTGIPGRPFAPGYRPHRLRRHHDRFDVPDIFRWLVRPERRHRRRQHHR